MLISAFFSTEVDFNDKSTKDEAYDFRFAKWLIKEKVKTCRDVVTSQDVSFAEKRK